jgi:hypothetical protein
VCGSFVHVFLVVLILRMSIWRRTTSRLWPNILTVVPVMTEDFLEQSCSWEAMIVRSASQEIHLLWNPKILYRVHKSPPLDYPEPVESRLPSTIKM